MSVLGNREVRFDRDHPKYKWIVLTNTTMGMLLATVNASIVLISLPAIFNGIHLNPLEPGNVSYLLWMIMGFLLVSAVLVVTLGRLGDMYGRVKMYNLGFVVFSIASIALAVDPLTRGSGALWLIIFRVIQGIGSSMIFANSTAILTDAFPASQRGMALGINQVAAIAGSFIGLILGGVLAEWDWRAVFIVSVPIGIVGTIWGYTSLHELGERKPGKIDWWGNATFGIGLSVLLAGITYGIQPYGGNSTGWSNPWVLSGVIGGAALLVIFCVVETKVSDPMFHLALFKNATFAFGNLAGLLSSIGRGGLQFMLIIWLQGIWLPLHGYNYADTPLWSGIYLLPLTIGFLVSGPLSGFLSDRFGTRKFAVGGLVLVGLTFIGLLLLPVNFPYWAFALLTALNGIGSGLFASPNTSAVMGAVPANQRGAAAGMRGTFFNSGSALSIGIFFTLMILGLAASLPHALTNGLINQGVDPHSAAIAGSLPPVASLFASFLGYNPLGQTLSSAPLNVKAQVPSSTWNTLTDKSFFPHLISQPFHSGLIVVFVAAAIMMFIAAAASLVQTKARPETVDVAVGAAGGAVPTEAVAVNGSSANGAGVGGAALNGAGRAVHAANGHGHNGTGDTGHGPAEIAIDGALGGTDLGGLVAYEEADAEAEESDSVRESR